MADDPTTTGLKWPLEGEPPDDWQETVAEATKQAEAAGADTSKAEVATGRGYRFELRDFIGDFQIVEGEQTLLFNIAIPPAGGMAKASPTNPPHTNSFAFPRSLIGDVDPEELFRIVVA